MSLTHIGLHDALAAYLRQVSLRESPILQALRHAGQQLADPGMQSAPEQAQFIALILKLMGAKRGIEIGVFIGYCSLWMAESLPADGELIACDVNSEWTKLAVDYWQQAGVADKITLKLADAKQTLAELLAAGEAEQFDFAYIDADKAGYDHYYEACLKLVRRNGLIMIDNTLWKGRLLDQTDQKVTTNAIRALNEKLRTDTRVELSLLPLGDGLTLLLKR